MMLYVFHVDTGTMLTLDINLALEDAIALKGAINKVTGIPIDKQVLLASGGESLEPNIRVCSYSAGTDTNPIYLFSKDAINAIQSPTATVEIIPDLGLKDEEIEFYLNMPISIHTVNTRCKLAKQISDNSRRLSQNFEKLVHEQHLQHQGWAAAMANLDDITAEFGKRATVFLSAYKEYLESRSQYLEILDSNDIQLLSRLPFLPALAEKEFEINIESTNTETARGAMSEEITTNFEEKKAPKTLLDWISEKERKYKIEELVHICQKGLEQNNESNLEILEKEISSFQESIYHNECRGIKGLENRLYGLGQLLMEAETLYSQQSGLAQAFVSNKSRAIDVRDPTVLPCLCDTHKHQLIKMFKNHRRLRDIEKRCQKAKQELVNNLHYRLKWIINIEERIKEFDTTLMLRGEWLKRLQKQLAILQQLHMAPSVYLSAVSEVVQRRAFSQAYLAWANELSCQLCGIYSGEVARRKDFQSQFEGHFLSPLFPGLEDLPPPFATQPPQAFDDNLPNITVEDIEMLRKELPQSLMLLSVPDITSINQFFLNRSSTNLKPDLPNPSASIEDRIVEAVTAAGLCSDLDSVLLQPAVEFSQSMAQSATTTTQPISSDKGFDSETDTEEFEKVGQSPCDINIERQQDIAIHPDKEEAIAGNSDEAAAGKNDITGIEDEFKMRLNMIGSTVSDSVADLKTDVGQLKQWIMFERTKLECLIPQIREALDHQYDSLIKTIKEKERSLEKLNQSREKMKKELHILREERKAQEMIKEMKSSGMSKKAEIERKSHRATRSISESQIGHVQGSRLELKDHDEIVARLKEQLALEREKAVLEERIRCEARLSKQLTQAQIKADADKQALFNESIRRLYDKKYESVRSFSHDIELARPELYEVASLFSDKQFDMAFIKAISAMEESSALAKSEIAKCSFSSSSPSPKCGHKDCSPSSSIVTIDTSQSLVRDAATSPEPSPRKCRVSKERLSESTNSLIQQGKISIGSCNEGDIVLVIWDENFGTYTILQETSSYTYFLHLDSLCSLGLQVSPLTDPLANPRKQYVIGEVVNKEYCQAKRAENRYHVPVGSRFYRVRVKPL